MEPDLLEQLEKEERDFAIKLNALFEIIHGPQWGFIDKAEQDTMLEQHDAGTTYLDCLRERIQLHS